LWKWVICPIAALLQVQWLITLMLSTYCFSCSTVLEESRRLLAKQKELLQQVKISQILSLSFSLSLSLFVI
jgi:hypothetical protein